jgi:CubicO group peptidase (beta-lactamase class C family)
VSLAAAFIACAGAAPVGEEWQQAPAARASTMNERWACVPQNTPALARLNEVVSWARGDDFDRILQGLRTVWAPGADRKDTLDAAIVNAGQWSVLSDALVAEEVCTEGRTRATGSYRNERTGAVDQLRVDVADTPDAPITGVRIEYAVRLAGTIERPDTVAGRIATLDAFASRLAANDVFSGVILVAHRGEPIYARGFGQANKALGIPIGVGTQFNLASMNKMFTAVATLQLVGRGALALDDTLADLLPADFATHAAGKIQVKHLLSHTSGLSMYGPSLVCSPPGSSFAYANYGFLLLGRIIEARTGMRYEDYLRLQILGPLEMANTSRYDLKDLSEYVTQGYYCPIPAVNDRLNRIPNKYLHIYTGGPMGGMYATAGDLLKFANGLRAGRLLTPATVELMKAPKPELGAPEYGFGVVRWQAPGVWGHSGRLPGADADLEFYDNDYVAIVLANYDNVNTPLLRLLRILFHEGPDGPVP